MPQERTWTPNVHAHRRASTTAELGEVLPARPGGAWG